MLADIRNCLYSNQISQYFECSPTALAKYIVHMSIKSYVIIRSVGARRENSTSCLDRACERTRILSISVVTSSVLRCRKIKYSVYLN